MKPPSLPDQAWNLTALTVLLSPWTLPACPGPAGLRISTGHAPRTSFSGCCGTACTHLPVSRPPHGSEIHKGSVAGSGHSGAPCLTALPRFLLGGSNNPRQTGRLIEFTARVCRNKARRGSPFTLHGQAAGRAGMGSPSPCTFFVFKPFPFPSLSHSGVSLAFAAHLHVRLHIDWQVESAAGALTWLCAIPVLPISTSTRSVCHSCRCMVSGVLYFMWPSLVIVPT